MQRALAGSALAALLGLLLCAAVAARVRDDVPKNVLTPLSHTLPKGEVGQDDPPYHVQFTDTFRGQPWPRGLFGCNTMSLGRPDLPQFNDCAKLPPGLTLGDYSNCENSVNGCWMLYGTPTKAGTYSFRFAASDGQGELIVRTYTVVIAEAKKRYDFRVQIDRIDKGVGVSTVDFIVRNSGAAASPATHITFETKTTSKTVHYSVERITSLARDQCSGLTCEVPKLEPHAYGITFRVTATLVGGAHGEGGTYVRIQAQVPCGRDDEVTCDDNRAPLGSAFERVAVGGR